MTQRRRSTASARFGPAAPLGGLIWGYWESLAPERLLLAQLLLARDRPEEALRVAQSFDGQRAVVDVAFLQPSLEIRRQVARQLGDEKREEQFARRIAALLRR